MSKPLGVILAGGLARRMGGGDKGLSELGSGTLLTHVINRVRPQVGELVLNANGDPARFARFGLPVICDSIGGFVGPLAGVLAGMDLAAKTGTRHVVSVAADTPFFPADLVERLEQERHKSGQKIVLAASRHPERGILRQPVFGLWPVALREDLRAALTGGMRKIVLWADQHGASVAVFAPCPPAPDPFFNVNAPEDLEKAREMLAGLSDDQ